MAIQIVILVPLLAYPGIVYGADPTPPHLPRRARLDGGHLGTFLGPPVTGVLFTTTASHGNYGWILWCTLLCSLAPSVIIGWLGMRQGGTVLEQIST